MKHIQEHIIFKLATILLIAAILTPSIVKVTHVFEDHKHDVCTDNLSQTHLHELNIECEFYKFKVNNNFTFTPSNFELLSIENNHKIYYSYYNYLNSHQQLSTYLRGPPNLM